MTKAEIKKIFVTVDKILHKDCNLHFKYNPEDISINIDTSVFNSIMYAIERAYEFGQRDKTEEIKKALRLR
jgi:hypothetical protein